MIIIKTLLINIKYLKMNDPDMQTYINRNEYIE